MRGVLQQDKQHVPVSGNIGWLDFTHGFTIANAVHLICREYRDLWPQSLMQLARFHGRSSAFTQFNQTTGDWLYEDLVQEMMNLIEQAVDYGQAEHIVSVHGVKTAVAAKQELTGLSEEQALLLAAVKRFVNSPIKHRYTRRTAYQSLQFVARE